MCKYTFFKTEREVWLWRNGKIIPLALNLQILRKKNLFGLYTLEIQNKFIWFKHIRNLKQIYLVLTH